VYKIHARPARPVSPQAARALQLALIAFFVLAVGFLLIVYLISPQIYTQVLLVHAAAGERPAAITLFLFAILLFVALLVVGVLRRWRWVFWGVLVAFVAQIIAIPVDVLQLAGVLPLDFPVWYEMVRLMVSILQLAIGIWMIWLYRRYATWAMGSTGRFKTSPGDDYMHKP